MPEHWRQIKCDRCWGHGLVAHYSLGDFEGASECDLCKGQGHLCVSPKGRLALYAGGQFIGQVSKKEAVNAA